MLQAIIPTIISGLFTLFSVLIGKRFITNPLHTLKVKQEIIGSLPDGPIKKKMQLKLEVESCWALEHGEAYTSCRTLIFWATASLALFVIAGSVILFMYIGLPIDLMTTNLKSLDVSVPAETLFQLLLDLLSWTFAMLAIPASFGAFGFALISLCRIYQTKSIENSILEAKGEVKSATKRPWRHIRTNNAGR